MRRALLKLESLSFGHTCAYWRCISNGILLFSSTLHRFNELFGLPFLLSVSILAQLRLGKDFFLPATNLIQSPLNSTCMNSEIPTSPTPARDTRSEEGRMGHGTAAAAGGEHSIYMHVCRRGAVHKPKSKAKTHILPCLAWPTIHDYSGQPCTFATHPQTLPACCCATHQIG